MKKLKIAFWISTGLVSLMMLNSAYMCIASPMMKTSIAHLGFPGYFRTELGITKLLGVIAILIPAIPARVKEWAYAGFFFMFVSGIMAHMIMGDPAAMWSVGIMTLILLGVSYVSFRKLQVATEHSSIPATSSSKTATTETK